MPKKTKKLKELRKKKQEQKQNQAKSSISSKSDLKATSNPSTVNTSDTNSPSDLNLRSTFAQFWSRHSSKTWAIISAVLATTAILGISLVGIPELYYQTEDGRLEKEEEDRKEEEARKQREMEEMLAEESKNIDLDRSITDLELGFDSRLDKRSLRIQAYKDWGEQNYENLLRLVYRDRYDGIDLIYGRLEGLDTENLVFYTNLQADINAGTLNESFSEQDIPGELWLKEPTRDENLNVLDSGEYRHEFYGQFDKDSFTTVYKKGSLVMQISPNGSGVRADFFILKEDTQLPAVYTTIGRVVEEDLQILDDLGAVLKPDDSVAISSFDIKS